MDPILEDQWDKWNSKYVPEQSPDLNLLREKIIEDLTNVSSMTVEEYTLFQKWCEVHNKYPTTEKHSLLGKQVVAENPEDLVFIEKVKSNIWIPQSPDDYQKLQPRLFYTDDSGEKEINSLIGLSSQEQKRTKDLPETWNTIRTFTSTMKNNSNIGRNLNYIVLDDVTGKYLGVICISSDFLDLTPRDKFIGWERTNKTQGHMIDHTAIGSTIVPLQPLGYNYVGGKLLALLCLSDQVQQDWKREYGDTLIAVTTTSLYGKNKLNGLSQYDGLKHWQKMGFSAGSVSYEPLRSTVQLMLQWLRVNYPRKYFEWYEAKKTSGQPYKRDHKNRSYNFIYSKLEIPKHLIRSDHQRGIYFSTLYNNSREFLRGEIAEDALDKSFDTSYDALNNLWKEKYASKRIRSLTEQNRVSSETLFYDDLIFMSFEETKKKYLTQVGR